MDIPTDGNGVPTKTLSEDLAAFATEYRIKGKGPLAVMLVVNDHAKKLGLPLNADELLTEQGGQVLGLGKASVQAILTRRKIERVLAEEGGRTSRGSIANMRAYVALLNKEKALRGSVNLEEAEDFWINEVRAFFAGKPFVMRLDATWGVRRSVRHLTEQAVKRQKEARGTMFLGTMMQHLVGAKLNVVLGAGKISHHSANQSDQRADRHGDFDLDEVSIHVSTAPSEALIRKCGENLGKNKRPIIITTRRGMLTAEGLLENAGIADRVDLIEFEQFVATNIFEMGQFKAEEQKKTFQAIVDVYNGIIENHETDHSLKIEMTSGK